MAKDIDINILGFHGLYSHGDDLEILLNQLEFDIDGRGYKCVTSQHDYPYLNVWKGRKQWPRDAVRDLLLALLYGESNEFKKAKVVGLFHSNATFAISRALEKYNNGDSLCKRIRLDKIILFGSVVPVDFDWGRFDIEVVNFIAQGDWVSRIARFFRMGQSGYKGFNTPSPNLNQYWDKEGGHSSYTYRWYDDIKKEVLQVLDGK